MNADNDGSRNEAEDANGAGGSLVVPTEILPSSLLVLPLFERPFLPAQALPLVLEEEPWLETVRRIGETPHKVVGLLLTREPGTDDVAPRNLHRVGCAVRMHHPMRSNGKIQFIAEGIGRFRVTEWAAPAPPLVAEVTYPEDDIADGSQEAKAYAMAIITAIKELVPLNPLYSEELKNYLNRFNLNEPSRLADFAASLTTAGREELQDVLDTIPVLERMNKALLLVRKELEVARLHHRINRQVEEKMSEQQRRFFLREQLKAIQKELGISKDDRTAESERFAARVRELELPDAARERITEEMEKFSVLESGSPEYAVTRNYLDWLTSLPWGRFSKDNLDLKRARRILDRDHDGLDDVKQRIIEFLAVGALRGVIGGSILLLVGPPGVGKTSIGRSIAAALDRSFYRFSLGGMRDEAEIKGHRRTYIGAMPGKFVQAIKECGHANPLIMLDEIDKVGASYHGDPASALLEVLDPEQNVDFLDHYLDVRFDLSKVLFVCTANQLDTIPPALLDRMEVIRLAGYLTEEKEKIARHHLWPRQLERAGVPKAKIRISRAALRLVIEAYARESGVRNLEKQLGRIVRKCVVEFADGREPPIAVGTAEVRRYLGAPRHKPSRPTRDVGVATGLAWTAMGGAILDIEASRVFSGPRGLKLTGKLGEVMRESADIAYSHVASNLEALGGQPGFFESATIHLHVPEGATPKDGPSAGITMATALLSLARKRRVPRRVAMTGELTLTGRILAVGGIREKVTAAKRSGIRELILPEENRNDFEELPAYVRSGMKVHFAAEYRDVVDILFQPPRKRRRRAS